MPLPYPAAIRATSGSRRDGQPHDRKVGSQKRHPHPVTSITIKRGIMIRMKLKSTHLVLKSLLTSNELKAYLSLLFLFSLFISNPLFADIYNVVEDFNAINDGSACTKTQIQNAIDQAEADGNGVVLIPPGTYRLDSGLSIDSSNVKLEGYGPGISVLKSEFSAGNIIDIGINSGDEVQNVAVNSISILQNKGPVNVTAIFVRNSSYINIHKVTARYMNRFAIFGDSGTDDARNISVSDCVIQTADDGIWFYSGAIAKISNCFFNGNANSQILFRQNNNSANWDGLVITGCTAEQWTTHFLVSGLGIANLRMTNNIIDRAKNYSFYFQPCASGVVHHCLIANNYFFGTGPDNTSEGIYINENLGGDVRNITFTGNHFSAFSRRGARIFGGVENIIINGNTFSDIAGVGFSIGAVRNLILTNNIIEEAENGTLLYGIEWQGGCGARENLQFSNNINAVGTTIGCP